ncbi:MULTISPECIES: tail fiber domain-containing protein [unclassified Microcoleus]|uniref:tail fiber domain-containing protein n=1 Tax=unclassified Microcoleus TaxID=2642155 RepID=UPI002FD186A9
MTVNDIYQRPNYFAGQYLLEDDFELEQKYHIDREQRHNRLLHVSGIAEGLKVTEVQEGGLKIKVSPGTVVDKQGKQIILHTERIVDLPGQKDNTLFIKYAEKKESRQEDTTDGYRRIVEEPLIDFDASERSIALAKLTVTDGKITKIDESVRQYCGLRLPGGGNSEVTLRSHGDNNPNLAQLTGSLSISGRLEVTDKTELNNTLTVKEKTTLQKDLNVGGNLNLIEKNAKLTVTGTTQLNNTLTVEDNTTLRKDLNVGGNLKVTGTSHLTGNVGIGVAQPKTRLEIRQDQEKELGPILTLSNHSGGANAGAAIDFNGTDVGTSDPTARLRSLDNNYSSHLVFYTKAPGSRSNTLQERLRITHDGKVGIGTAEPKEKLHVEGNLYVKGNIYTEGRYWVGNRLWQNDPWLQLNLGNEHRAVWGNRSDTYPSDLRLKTDIVPIANALDTIEQLNPVSFKWADINYFLKKIENAMLESPLQHEQYSEAMEELSQRIKIKLEKPQVGFLAQDVERVFSDWVEEDVDGYKRINMTQLNALIVQAIKEIKGNQEKTTTEIHDLQHKVTILETRKD